MGWSAVAPHHPSSSLLDSWENLPEAPEVLFSHTYLLYWPRTNIFDREDSFVKILPESMPSSSVTCPRWHPTQSVMNMFSSGKQKKSFYACQWYHPLILHSYEERSKVRLKSCHLMLIFCFQPEEELPEQPLLSQVCEEGVSHIKVCSEWFLLWSPPSVLLGKQARPLWHSVDEDLEHFSPQ